MKYDSPELREQLAAEYLLGTMPVLVRRRFQRLLATDPQLRQVVEDWTARFEPLDHAAAAQEPPERIWRAIERQLALPPAATEARPGWFDSLALWRGAAFASAAIATIAIIDVAVRPPPIPTNVVAILSDDQGEPGWIAESGGGGDEVAVAPIRKVVVDAAHAFELWAIAGGQPQPLGLLPSEPSHKLMVQASLLPTSGVLAVSIEPAGGSPTGLPTGPVRYKGKLLPREP
jgi:anti-sigma-K factor RskA